MSVTFSQIKSELEQLLQNNWSHTPIVWDNTELDTTSEWIRATFVPFNSSNATIGGTRVLRSGVFSIQIFIPLGGGSGRAYELSDLAVALLENIQMNTQGYTLFTYAANVVQVGDGRRKVDQIERGQFQVNVNVPWEAI